MLCQSHTQLIYQSCLSSGIQLKLVQLAFKISHQWVFTTAIINTGNNILAITNAMGEHKLRRNNAPVGTDI